MYWITVHYVTSRGLMRFRKIEWKECFITYNWIQLLNFCSPYETSAFHTDVTVWTLILIHTPCNIEGIDQRFVGTYCLRLQDRSVGTGAGQ